MATSKDPEIPKLELELFNDVSSSMQANIEKARQASLPPNWRELDLNDPRLSAPAFQVPDFTTLEGMKVRGLLDENGNATKLGEDYILLEDHGMLMDGNPTEKAEAFTTPLDDIVSGAKFDLLRTQVDYTAPESQKAKRLFQIRRDSGIDEPDVETSFVDDVFNVLKGVNQMRIAVGTALGGKGLGMMDDSGVSSEEQAAAAMSIAQGFKNTPLETLGAIGAFVQRNITGRMAELTGTPKEEVENKGLEIDLTNARRKLENREASAANVIDAVTETTAAAQTYQAARENFKAKGGTEEEFEQIQSAAEGVGGMVSDPLNPALGLVVRATKTIPNIINAAKTANSFEKSAVASSTLERIAAKSGELTQRGKLLEGEIIAAQKQAQDLLTVGKASEARALLGQAQAKSAEVQDISSRLAKLDEGFKVNQGVLQAHQARVDEIMTSPSFRRVAGSNVVKSVSDVTDKLGDATGWAARGIKKIEYKLGFSKIPWLIKAAAGVPYAKVAGTYYSGRAGLIYGAPLLKKMAQFGATVSEEMLQVKQTLPFWRRVASKQNSRVGQMMAGLGEFATPIARGVASPIKGVAHTLPYTALYESINSNGLDEAALRRAGANALVFGPLTRLAGGKNDWQKASVGDLVNFRNKLSVEPEKLQVFEAVPSRQFKQFVASFDAAYPNMFDYNFTKSGNSFFDSQTKTVTLNVNDSAGMVKALAGHEINHALQFVHQSDSAVIAKMLGSEGKAGLVRDIDGNFDPEFKAWGNEYNARMKAQGLPERPIEDLAVEYYTDVGAQTLFEDVVSGKMYKAAQKSNVRRRIEEMFNKTMAAPPIVKEIHYKLGGATDGHGRMVMGSGLLADGIRELPEVKAMVRNMYRESAGLPSKYAVSPNESFGKSTNPNHHKAAEAIKKLNEESVKNKTPLVDGALHPDAKGNGTGRIPSEYFAQLEEMGIIPDGSWGRAIDINENIDQAVAYLLDYRPIRQGRSIQVEGRTINNIKPVGWVLHEGRLYLAAMDLNQLNANVTKAAGSEVAKGLKLSKEDIMNDINAVAELHAKNKSTDEYFKKVADKKGYPERWRSRKNFINATQGLMTEGQLAGNPMFHALGQTKKSGIYRTFAFDLLDDAVRMNGESVTGYGPNNYYNLKQNLMPQMPNVNRNGDIISDTAGKTKFMPEKIDSPTNASGAKVKAMLKHSKEPRSFVADNGRVESPGLRYLPEPVYHGTPHKVDSFSTEKIGTGEGAQAYGWGLYFAESKGVAEDYRRTLSHAKSLEAIEDRSGLLVDGDFRPVSSFEHAYMDTEYRTLRDIAKKGEDAVLAGLVERLEKLPDGPVREAAQRAKQKVEAIVEANNGKSIEVVDDIYSPEFTGNLYTVKLKPEAHEFLDWDKPFSEQSPKVQAAIKFEVVKETEPSDSKWLLKLNGRTINGYQTRKEALASAFESTGGQFYQTIAIDQSPRRASQMLAELGIPGIRYLDGGSRGAGDGTRNYVIFDDKDIEITHINEKPLPKQNLRFMPESNKKQSGEVRKSTFKGSPKQSPSNKDIAKSISYLISGALSRQMEREHEKTNGRRPQ